jgi:hypothetical protein
VHAFGGWVHCQIKIALGEAFKHINGLVDLSEKIIGIEVPIMIFASLEDNLGLPGGCEYE